MKPLPSAGKPVTSARAFLRPVGAEDDAEDGKICNRCRARENVELVPSAEKHATGAKREKTCNWCQARENVELVPSAGKRATGAKRA